MKYQLQQSNSDGVLVNLGARSGAHSDVISGEPGGGRRASRAGNGKGYCSYRVLFRRSQCVAQGSDGRGRDLDCEFAQFLGSMGAR